MKQRGSDPFKKNYQQQHLGNGLFLDQTEAWRAEKYFFWDWLSPHPPYTERLDVPLGCLPFVKGFQKIRF